MKEKIIKKRKSGTLTIDPEIVTEISNFCKKKGIVLKFFVEEAVKEKMQKEKAK